MRHLTALSSILLVAQLMQAQIQHNTAVNPIVICSPSYTLEQFESRSDAPLDINHTCLEHPELLSTVWLEFEIENGTELSFVLSPLNSDDDIDFVLYEVNYEMPSSISQNLLRCVATGLNLGDNRANQNNCTGPTGIFPGASDITETSGCNRLKDNFVEAINTAPNSKYLLMVTNFKATNGFTLEIISPVQLVKNDLCSEIVSTEEINDLVIQIGPVIPNPLSNEGLIIISSQSYTRLDMVITDLLGRVLYKSTIVVDPGETIAKFESSRFTPGLYTLNLSYRGQQVSTRKFIKQ
jgi:hypothetical protein